ncbi:MAG TPA: phenylalanine--tRNA ligase subunit beta, partial [Clostridiales bacterium]|nr:phenylalanine--tRNA ligase subunit beta [Clostridiales bacterium]
GENSEISEDTTTVIFESAGFLGSSIRTTARDLGIRTESSGRFEKGLDPENALPALNRACELVTLLGAGEIVNGVIDVRTPKADDVKLHFTPDAINQFLGTSIAVEEMKEILKKLHFVFDTDGKVIVPTWRSDVRTMNDLAEEVARIYGYNRIVSSLFAGDVFVGKRTPMQQFRLELSSLCHAAGMYEILTYSFISPKTFDMLRLPASASERKAVVISNPLGENTGIMRTTAIGSILEAVAHNRSFRNPVVKLFELATVYLPTSPDNLPVEAQQLVMATCGSGDFFALKGICEGILHHILPKSGSLAPYMFVAETENATFHPGRCAHIMLNGEVLGTIGQIHPAVQDRFDIDGATYVAVLSVEKLVANKEQDKQYHALPKYPAVTRDLAFVCDKALEVGTMQKVLAEAGGKRLESITLFDIYTGEQVGPGKKSVAFKLTLRDAEQTLTDEMCDQLVKKLLRTMEEKCGVILRS